MYLSKLLLNPRSPAARRDVAAPYELHRTLVRAFPAGAAGGDRLLFRVEPEAGAAGPVVLVQTAHAAPDWSPLLADGYLLRALGPKAFAPVLSAGQHLAFRLVANPTKKVEGKRIPLVFDSHEDPGVKTYGDWLGRKAETAGFAVVSVQDAPFYLAPRRSRKPVFAKHELPLFGVRFDGVLRVTDPERLVAAVRGGIGPAKGFGFGLLSLAPVR